MRYRRYKKVEYKTLFASYSGDAGSYFKIGVSAEDNDFVEKCAIAEIIFSMNRGKPYESVIIRNEDKGTFRKVTYSNDKVDVQFRKRMVALVGA